MEPKRALEARISELEKGAEELHRVAENFTNHHGSAATGGSINIRLDAGKFSIWAAAGVCVVALSFILGASVMAGFWLTDRFGSIDGQFGKVETKFSDVKNNDDIHDLQIQKLQVQQKQQEKK